MLIEQIARLVEGKAIRPVVTAVFSFGDSLKAFEQVMTGHARGKVMLDLGNESLSAISRRSVRLTNSLRMALLVG